MSYISGPSPPPSLLNINKQQRHDSCIKVKWLWIVRWPSMITTERKQTSDAFILCCVWRPARCLVNRRQTPTPEARTALLLFGSHVKSNKEPQVDLTRWRWFFTFILIWWSRWRVGMMHSLCLCATYSTQSILCWTGSAFAVDFYANVKWKRSHAGTVLN